MDELNEKKIEEQIDENTVASSSSPIDEQNSTIEETIDKSNICAKCGATLEPDQLFCPKCGAPKNSTKRICPKCAAELTSEQEFCP